MNRVEILRELSRKMCRLLGKEELTEEEKGNLAMAVESLENDLQYEQLNRAIDQCIMNRDVSEACYRLMRLIYRDWESRIAPSQDQAYCDIIKENWRLKQRKGNSGSLESFVLIRQYRDFPRFYKALDLFNTITEG